MKITLPIYYTQTFKSKKPKKMLVGLNNYRNWHHSLSNAVKRHYHELTIAAVGDAKFGKVRVHYDVYAARNGTDGGNIRSVIEKFFLDGLVEAGAIIDDSIAYVKGESSEYFIDPLYPRIEITILDI